MCREKKNINSLFMPTAMFPPSHIPLLSIPRSLSTPAVHNCTVVNVLQSLTCRILGQSSGALHSPDTKTQWIEPSGHGAQRGSRHMGQKGAQPRSLLLPAGPQHKACLYSVLIAWALLLPDPEKTNQKSFSVNYPALSFQSCSAKTEGIIPG